MEGIRIMEIINIIFELKSFSWANGLYIIVSYDDDDGTTYNLCKINDGIPELYDDGRFIISCTGTKNPGITKTNLIYDTKRKMVVENKKDRRLEKLIKIKEKYEK
jgi:hypothetical protein